MSKDAITVGELVEILKGFSDDLPVLADGCDCYGEAAGIALVSHGEGIRLIVIRVDNVQDFGSDAVVAERFRA